MVLVVIMYNKLVIYDMRRRDIKAPPPPAAAASAARTKMRGCP